MGGGIVGGVQSTALKVNEQNSTVSERNEQRARDILETLVDRATLGLNGVATKFRQADLLSRRVETGVAALSDDSHLVRDHDIRSQTPAGNGKSWGVTTLNSSTDNSLAGSLPLPVEVSVMSIDARAKGMAYVAPHTRSNQTLNSTPLSELPVLAETAAKQVPGSELTVFYQSLVGAGIEIGLEAQILELLGFGPISLGPGAHVDVTDKQMNRLLWAVTSTKLVDKPGEGRRVKVTLSREVDNINDRHGGVAADIGIPTTLRGLLNTLPIRRTTDEVHRLPNYGRDESTYKQFAAKFDEASSEELAYGSESSNGWMSRVTVELNLDDVDQARAYEDLIGGDLSSVAKLAAESKVVLSHVGADIDGEEAGSLFRVSKFTLFHDETESRTAVNLTGHDAGNKGLVYGSQEHAEGEYETLFTSPRSIEVKAHSVLPGDVTKTVAEDDVAISIEAKIGDTNLEQHEFQHARFVSGILGREAQTSAAPASVYSTTEYGEAETRADISFLRSGVAKLHALGSDREAVISVYAAAFQKLSGTTYDIPWANGSPEARELAVKLYEEDRRVFTDGSAGLEQKLAPSRTYFETFSGASLEADARSYEAALKGAALLEKFARIDTEAEWATIADEVQKMLHTDAENFVLHLGALSQIAGADNVHVGDFVVTQKAGKNVGAEDVILLQSRDAGRKPELPKSVDALKEEEGIRKPQPERRVTTRHGKV